jgi:hypothetical protein
MCALLTSVVGFAGTWGGIPGKRKLERNPRKVTQMEINSLPPPNELV